MADRLQKILAAAGVASRRSAEALIRAGRVRVNGRPVTELGRRADPDRDRIEIDGRPIRRPVRHRYLALHKPAGVLSAAIDDRGRTTVRDLVGRPGADGSPPVTGRVYPVGRLDLDSSGLILLTDDGDLAQRLTHPRYHVEKEYLVEVAGRPDRASIERFAAGGLPIDDRTTAPAECRVIAVGPRSTQLGVVLHEGRRRQIRRLWLELGHPVLDLRRVRIGPIALGDLPLDGWRTLSPAEVARLHAAAGLADGKGKDADRD